jgi:hypothetical protein
MTASFRRTKPEDIKPLAENLRKADIEELAASTGLSPEVALRLSILSSKEANTIVLEDGTVVGVFGVSKISDIVGCPWLVGTDLLPTIRTAFLRGSTKWIREKNDEFPVLTNFVHANNETAIQWLRFLGFNFIQRIEEHGVGKEPFYEFVRIQENV